jgi:hypothetical protein
MAANQLEQALIHKPAHPSSCLANADTGSAEPGGAAQVALPAVFLSAAI